MKPGVWFLAWPGCRLLAGVNFLQFEFTILADFFQQNIFTQMFKSASEEPEIGTRGREQNLFAQGFLSLSLSHTPSFFLLELLLLFVSGSTFPRGDIDLLEAKQAPFCSHTTHARTHTHMHARICVSITSEDITPTYIEDLLEC